MSTTTNNTFGRRSAQSVGRPDSFYPSPFFDIAQNYIPRAIKDTFDWCLYYQLTNPLVSAVTHKLAAYPITDLVYDDDSEAVVDDYRDLFERQFRLRTFLIETNLDRYTFGNSFVSVAFPFKKTLLCQDCKKSYDAEKTTFSFRGYKFVIDCECGYSGAADVKDEPVKNRRKIRLIRWNPKAITIRYNELTGDIHYYYTMPRHLKNDILIGKRETLLHTPQAFIDALGKDKAISLDPSKIFHARRPSVSRDPFDSGWGAPMILPVLKDIFFVQILRKAQETIAMEHIVPMRTMFPQITADGNNPYAHINLKDWQKEVEGQIRRWRQDNNHIPVMPVPIGTQTLGGQGRQLLLHQEIRAYNDVIIAGLGVPTGFIYGEAMYSGASVNLRALENEFLGNRQDMLRLVEFIGDRVSTFLDLPRVKLRFKPFKMADDIQRASFNLQLAQGGYISRHTQLQSVDHDYDTERKIIEEELKDQRKDQKEQMVAQAEAQGESMVISTKYQIEAQQAQQTALPPEQQQPGGAPTEGMGPPGPVEAPPPGQGQQQQQGGPPGMADPSPVNQQTGANPMVDLMAEAKKVSSQLKKMDEVARYQALARIKAHNPDLYQLVNQAVAGGNQRPLQPLPEKLPPRAGPGRAQI
ncbi:MAG: hypothetical protein HN396_16840 [Gemmatimonadales bacterium]|nr:hypothetical protein [Gemmatimonadales bacterium]